LGGKTDGQTVSFTHGFYRSTGVENSAAISRAQRLAIYSTIKPIIAGNVISY